MFFQTKNICMVIAVCIVGNISAYHITLKNHTDRELEAFAYFFKVPGFQPVKIGPYKTKTIHPESDKHWLSRLTIDSLGTYKKLDKESVQGVDFVPNKQEGVYSWHGLTRDDHIIHVLETRMGLKAIFFE